jgi:hypothetical protein
MSEIQPRLIVELGSVYRCRVSRLLNTIAAFACVRECGETGMNTIRWRVFYMLQQYTQRLSQLLPEQKMP